MPIPLAQSACHSYPCNDHFWSIYTLCLAGWLLLTQWRDYWLQVLI